ncbi:unnamed protein product [Penicillium salamii]|uniref:Uncharacterized protein n=1 Tax=Penicillium salamii TaxID=1612424 RepID=A0A9W4NNV6_9EURO|nr:unnamed protein product [Penicillium salamii]
MWLKVHLAIRKMFRPLTAVLCLFVLFAGLPGILATQHIHHNHDYLHK